MNHEELADVVTVLLISAVAAHVIAPEFVVSEGIDVLVMGTVARGGVSGVLIGNTAERVLRKLPCSVLTVKPDGFVSPVRLET